MKRRTKEGIWEHSICWECQNARADACFATPRESRTWVKEYVLKTIPTKSGKNTETWIVKECAMFTKEKKRKRMM